MLSSPSIKLEYAKIQRQLFYMIPEKWDKIYLYASITNQINNLQTGELYFYYYPKGILKKNPVNVYEIPSKFSLDEEMYLQLVEDLYSSIKELRKLARKPEKELWSSVTIKIEDFKFIVEYSYEDLLHSEYSNSDRHIIWVYENLNKPLESFNKSERNIISKYLLENHNEKKDIYSEPIYKNHNFNVVKYKKEKEVYISEEDQDIGDQIINDQFGRIDEKSRREYGKRDEAKTYNLGKRKEINKKIKNVKYKKEETKSEFQKKKKTYIDQIEEQQHAIKSQIISKK
ncbi:MAG: immunity protein YezG family protein [Clostridia bacterium]